MTRVLISLLTFTLYASPLYAEYKMHFFLPEFAPYTEMSESGEAFGIGIDKMIPILDALDVEYTFQVGSNHGRALAEMKAGRSDGFFMATRNDMRDRHGVFSDQLMVNRWVWIIREEDKESFNPKLPSFKTQAKVASLLNTNTEYYLTKHKYNKLPASKDAEELSKRLSYGELDAILIAEVVFMHSIKEQHMLDYHVALHQAKEFGVYISHDFLAKHPKFMEKLNAEILRNREKE
ncbi:substrate-binding periplasmic protein [Vibrio mexicanus]|uniref:substrate-binding periplasmic protein n=1 Tax=Vibrio mexicanus TaxID=1004326 RepID=UPI00063BFBE9|nr:transporter substrate-binding domain-containing protein [Vibrio mexicanus]